MTVALGPMTCGPPDTVHAESGAAAVVGPAPASGVDGVGVVLAAGRAALADGCADGVVPALARAESPPPRISAPMKAKRPMPTMRPATATTGRNHFGRPSAPRPPFAVIPARTWSHAL